MTLCICLIEYIVIVEMYMSSSNRMRICVTLLNQYGTIFIGAQFFYERQGLLFENPTVWRGLCISLHGDSISLSTRGITPSRRSPASSYISIKGKVLKVFRSQYGLAESGDYWHATFANHLTENLKMNPMTSGMSLSLDARGVKWLNY